MRIIQDYLSIWEIAHRWHDSDPNTTDPLSLPLPVQDSLRVLTRALVIDEFHVLHRNGVQYWNYDDIPKIDEFISPDKGHTITIEDEDNYADYTERKLRKYYEAVDGLDKTIKDRIYDKDKLDSIFLDKLEVQHFCLNNDFALPEFWFSEKDKLSIDSNSPSSETKEKKLRPNQLDRELCRAIAQTLWHQNPEMTIADIYRSHEVKIFGNGGQYREKTLREWISDLDVRVGQTRGRPKI